MLDHRESPGMTESEIHKINPQLRPSAGRGLHETNIVHCTHCQKGMVVHPLFMADLPYCHHCDAYICESCKLTLVVTGVHMPFSKIIEEAQYRAEKGLPQINLERLHG